VDIMVCLIRKTIEALYPSYSLIKEKIKWKM